ncbi:hypothetical protein [Paenibacillus sp. UNC499MF]|uniref:hypothetical protein n=1 Tax=Paenibacillus sp. UNC499MF TaxID=1502751 RepID=UPI0008A0167D|nr:hypothetical protein [Paenibacillus sp. UNC499MF]SEG73311.1 hypothetical protein SAMN02799616_04620 [Paenibacillus sp. UNC499MF]
MFTILAVFTAFFGLFVTAASAYTAWMLHRMWKRDLRSAAPGHAAEILQRITPLDYGQFALTAIGMVMLLADLVAVLRDADAFPDYHIGYLLCGFLFVFLGMLMSFGRLLLTVRAWRSSGGAAFPHHHGQPHRADKAE